MRVEPLVDAPDVEPMVALGQDPDSVVGGKFREANYALGVQPGQLQIRRVVHDWEGLQGLPLHPGVG